MWAARRRAVCGHLASHSRAARRRKQREARKFSKAVQAERLKEKAQAKKAGVDALTRLRKQRQRQGFAGACPGGVAALPLQSGRTASAWRTARLALEEQHCGVQNLVAA